MKKFKILIIIQRSNGDVFLSSPLIDTLYNHYKNSQIDLLVNDDTLGIAKTLNHISKIHLYQYRWRRMPIFERIKKEFLLIKSIYRKYDLSICLTASDRSVFYAIISAKYSIAAVEKEWGKSWWKRLSLKKYYFVDTLKHIILNNAIPLDLLKIGYTNLKTTAVPKQKDLEKIEGILQTKGIKNFIIFHPSAQYKYKMLNTETINTFILLLNNLNISIIITGGKTEIDEEISNTIPKLSNIYNFIGKTSLGEYIALSHLSTAYIGMDTLNMHIAAAQSKKIFAIFGPTLTSMWSPWSNDLSSTHTVFSNSYDNITIFQTKMPCLPCGKAGCNDQHGPSECLVNIQPHTLFNEIQQWLK